MHKIILPYIISKMTSEEVTFTPHMVQKMIIIIIKTLIFDIIRFTLRDLETLKIVLSQEFIFLRLKDLLGDSQNCMLPILVTSSAKRIASQILVIVKLNGRKAFILRALFSFVPARNYLFKISNLSRSCSILRMSMLTIFSINDVNSVILMSLLLPVNICQTLL